MFGLVIRFVVSALVLMVVSWLLPGVEVAGFMAALWAAVLIAVVGWAVERLFGRNISPQARGITGFLVSAVTIWLVGQFMAGFNVGLFGALLAALVIGLIDAVVPTELR